MSESGNTPDSKTIARYEAALTDLGYEIYKVSGVWYANDVDYERNPNYADGPYETRDDAIQTTFNNLGLELDDEEGDDPAAPAPK